MPNTFLLSLLQSWKKMMWLCLSTFCILFLVLMVKSLSTMTAIIILRRRALREHRPRPRWIRILMTYNGDCIVQSYICDRIFMMSWWVFPELSAILCENALCRSVEESFKNSCIWIQMLTTCAQFNQFFLIHRYSLGKIFTKIRSVVFMCSCSTDGQTDRQMLGKT